VTIRLLSCRVGAFLVLGLLGCGRSEATSSTSNAPLVREIADEGASTSVGLEALRHARDLFKARAGFLPAAEVARFRAEVDQVHVVPQAARARANAASVVLPRTASGAMAIESGAMKLEVKPLGFANSALEWAEHIAVHPNVAPGTTAFRVVVDDGVEDFYQVDDPREQLSFSYEVKLTNVAGLRLVEGNVEFLESNGNPVLRAPSPIVLDASGRLRGGKLSVQGCAYDSKPIGPWGRAVTAPGATKCTIVATLDGRGLRYPVLVDPTWQATTGNAKRSHAYHKLVRLTAGPDTGKVLLIGGTGSEPGITELFNPATGTWATASALPTGITLGVGMNAVVLSTGQVVALGGFPTSGTTTTAQGTTLLRDATTGTWTSAATGTARAWHAMVPVVIDGKPAALAIGGSSTSSLSSTSLPLKSAEYYFPVGPTSALDDTWVGAGSMVTGRTKTRAVLMGDGRVLVAGGETYTTFTTATETAEIYSPSTKTWAAAPSMTTKRSQLELVALNGTTPRAIAAGGSTSTSASSAVNTLEYFDGSTWTTLAATLSSTRWQFSSAVLDDGKVLFTGGQSYNTSTFTTYVLGTADLFLPGSSPTTGTMTGAGSMAIERMFHATVNIPGTGALVVGGLAPSTETTNSEIFNTAVGGTCTVGGTACPSGLSCVDGVCCASTGCPEGQTCAAPGREGVCTKPKGTTCTSNSECATGYCVTGVCCESACSGGCKACNEAGKEGTCVLAPAGTDPGGFCTGTYDITCGKKCDGTGKCSISYAPEGTACGASLADAGTGKFCTTYSCSPYGSCLSKTNNCGLTCTTSVTCDETTKTCSATASGIKAGQCLIAGQCYAYGDINPKDSCQVCDPPTNKLAWSTAASCMEGGVDTGSEEDTSIEDTGSVEDTGMIEDTSTTEDTGVDAGEDASTGAPGLPEASTCGCRVPGRSTSTTGGALAALGLALAVVSRRRAQREQ